MNRSVESRRVAVVIDDDADIRNLLELILTEAGFDTVLTGDGISGIRAVRDYQPSLVTLDINMPGMDGFETLKRIKNLSNCYTIMISARNDEFDLVNGLQSGADDYLSKPFRPRELRARVDAGLRRSQGSNVPDISALTVGDLAGAWPSSALVASRSLETTPTSSHPAAPTGAKSAPAKRQVPPSIPGDSAPSSFMRREQNQAAARYVESGYSEAASAESGYAESARRSIGVDLLEEPRGWHDALTGQVASFESFDAEGDDFLEHNALRLSKSMRIATLHGLELDLTRTEFDLMAALLESKRRVRSKADLTLMLRGEHYVTAYFVDEADKRAIEAHISNLRRKLNDSNTVPKWIETVRGVGYRLAPVQAD